jgi:heat-inducible transcriptional repressor
MARVDKKAIILECIISEYIKTTMPVGSQHLQSIIDMEVSSATIRNYFKQMVEEGVLVQFHISGGRVPSLVALKEFWSERLAPVKSVQISDLNNFNAASKDYKIASIIKINESDKLLGSYVAGSKYIVSEFEKGEVLFCGDVRLRAFLDELVGLEASQIKELASHYGVAEIYAKLSSYLADKETEIANKEELLEIAKNDNDWAREKMLWFMDGSVASEVGHGIYFRNLIPDGYMAVKTEAKIGDKNAEILYVGHLSRDFGGFLCALN